jgi:hypothetical protein
MTPTPIPIPAPMPTPASNRDSARDAERADENCLMAELSIFRAGRHYFYDGYRYERLADAVAYAHLVQGHARRSGPMAR